MASLIRSCFSSTPRRQSCRIGPCLQTHWQKSLQAMGCWSPPSPAGACLAWDGNLFCQPDGQSTHVHMYSTFALLPVLIRRKGPRPVHCSVLSWPPLCWRHRASPSARSHTREDRAAPLPLPLPLGLHSTLDESSRYSALRVAQHA